MSEKIKWCKSKIRELDDERLKNLEKYLDKALNLLDKRNKLVHGQIYFAPNVPEKLIPSRPNDKENLVYPSDAYDLAEDMYDLHRRILSENSFALLAALKGRIDV